MVDITLSSSFFSVFSLSLSRRKFFFWQLLGHLKLKAFFFLVHLRYLFLLNSKRPLDRKVLRQGVYFVSHFHLHPSQERQKLVFVGNHPNATATLSEVFPDHAKRCVQECPRNCWQQLLEALRDSGTWEQDERTSWGSSEALLLRILHKTTEMMYATQWQKVTDASAHSSVKLTTSVAHSTLQFWRRIANQSHRGFTDNTHELLFAHLAILILVSLFDHLH